MCNWQAPIIITSSGPRTVSTEPFSLALGKVVRAVENCPSEKDYMAFLVYQGMDNINY